MKTLKGISAALVFLALGGCATDFGTRVTETISAVAKFSITQGQLDTARASYNAAVLAPLRRYALLPRCKTGQSISISNPCHDRWMLKKIRNADKNVENAFADTQLRISNGDATGAVLAYDILTAAIDTAKKLIAQSGVEVL